MRWIIFLMVVFCSSCASSMVGFHIEKNGDFGIYTEQTVDWSDAWKGERK